MTAIEPSTAPGEAAVAFLRALFPDKPRVLAAFKPGRKGAADVDTFMPDEEDRMRAWIIARNGKKQIYYLFNGVRRPFRGAEMPEKVDVASFNGLFADLDPDPKKPLADERARILARLSSASPPPSFIVDSGGGYQAGWFVVGTVDDVLGLAEYESKNRALGKTLGADHCWNANRVLRLPGTVNIADGKKLAVGRSDAPAAVIRLDAALAYRWDEFPLDPEGPDSNVERLADHRKAAGFPRTELPDAILEVIKGGTFAEGGKEFGGDRSRAVFGVAVAMVRAGRTDAEIEATLLDPRNGISGHVLAQGNPARSARRAAERARRAAEGEFVRNDKRAVVANHQGNVRLALSRIGVELSFDEFSRNFMIEGPLDAPLHVLEDHEVVRLYLAIEERFGFRPIKDYFRDVVEDECRQHPYHPVKDYLNGLKWDGTFRTEEWLITTAGAEDAPFVRAVSKAFLIAAVKRIFEPGCKFDEMLVLESEVQGLNKSQAISTLTRHWEWYSDSLPLDGDDKKVIEQTRGKWILEAGELKGMRKSEVEHLKAFLSRQVDRSRLAWGKLTAEVPRCFVIVGTTNSFIYLKDSTGNRRFWPVRISAFDLVKLAEAVDQLWAEAVACWRAGEDCRLDPKLWGAAAEEQEARLAIDPWIDMIASRLDQAEVTTGKMTCDRARQIIDMGEGQWTHEAMTRFSEAIKQLGWEHKRKKHRGIATWHYAKGKDAGEQERVIYVGRRKLGGDLVIKYEDEIDVEAAEKDEKP